MASQKPFLDGYPMESSWLGTQLSTLHSSSNSQNDLVVFDGNLHAPALGDSLVPRPHATAISSSEENKRLHQDHKALKRVLDRASQDTASSLASLHEKASRTSSSICDLHADVKKIERLLIYEAESSVRPTVADMELKLGNAVRSLETKLCSRILEQVTSSVNTKMGELVAQIGAKMSASQDRTHEDLNKIVASINGLKADMQQLQGVVSSSESRSQLAPMSIGSTPLPQPLAYASSFDMPLLLPLQPPPAPGRDTASPDQAPEMAATGANIGGGVAGSLCITVNHSIAEHRTSSKGRFSIAEAMRCVDRQHPYRLEEGWPVALAKSKRQKRPE